MKALIDLLRLKKRASNRVYIDWPIEVQISGQDASLAFCGRDISVHGLRLESDMRNPLPDSGDSGRAQLLIRVPGKKTAIQVEAKLKWGLEKEGKSTTGWEFTRLARDDQEFIEGYVLSHKEDWVEI